jgi:hypothetical protein
MVDDLDWCDWWAARLLGELGQSAPTGR